MSTDPSNVQLTDAQRKALAAKADETGRSVAELIDELLTLPVRRPPRQPREGQSLFDVLEERGMIGAMRGPGDLSCNPSHMQGFGESRAEPDTA